MKDVIKKALTVGLGLAVVSKEQIEKVVDELVKRGEVSTAESKELINELMHKGEEQQREFNIKIRDTVQKLLADLDVATKDHIQSLEKKIQDLKAELNEYKTPK